MASPLVLACLHHREWKAPMEWWKYRENRAKKGKVSGREKVHFPRRFCNVHDHLCSQTEECYCLAMWNRRSWTMRREGRQKEERPEALGASSACNETWRRRDQLLPDNDPSVYRSSIESHFRSLRCDTGEKIELGSWKRRTCPTSRFRVHECIDKGSST